jgi:hypothetical protein
MIHSYQSPSLSRIIRFCEIFGRFHIERPHRCIANARRVKLSKPFRFVAMSRHPGVFRHFVSGLRHFHLQHQSPSLPATMALGVERHAENRKIAQLLRNHGRMA